MDTIIKLEGVRKSFSSGKDEIKVLDGVDFELAAGEKVAVIGASGSGKTTLISIIGTILKPDSGKVFIEGMDTTRMSERELEKIRGKKIAFVFQNGYLIEELSVEENIFFFSKRAGADKSRVREIINSLGIPPRKNVWELSGGEYQRVAIARAMCIFPKIILADEPTGNLDPKTAHNVITELLSFSKDNLTLLITTHNLSIAKRLEKIYKIENGKIHEVKKDDL